MPSLVDFLRKRQGLADSASVPIPTIGFDSLLMTAFQFLLVELQRFLLGSFSCIGHVAFMWFFDSKDCRILTSTDEYLSEEASTFLVFKSVDGEYLSTIDFGESKDSLDLIETFLELALIEEHNHIGVVDDSLLDDRRTDNILDFLC